MMKDIGDRTNATGVFNIETSASCYVNYVTLVVFNAKEGVLVVLPQRVVGW